MYRWCTVTLGAQVESVLFRSGHLAIVVGLSLSNGRRVVVKVRGDDVRIRAVTEIQRRLFAAGYPCPPVIAGPFSIGRHVFTAEGFVEAGSLVGEPPVDEMARLLAEVVRRAGNAEDAPALLAPLPWLGWDHGGSGLWPAPDDLDVDLNDPPGPRWLEEAGHRVRHGLALDDGRHVIGHGDWRRTTLVGRSTGPWSSMTGTVS